MTHSTEAWLKTDPQACALYDWYRRKRGQPEAVWGTAVHWYAFDACGPSERAHLVAQHVLEVLIAEYRHLNPRAVVYGLVAVLEDVVARRAKDVVSDLEVEVARARLTAAGDYAPLRHLAEWASDRARICWADEVRLAAYRLIGDVTRIVESCMVNGSYGDQIQLFREGRSRPHGYRRDGVTTNYQRVSICQWCHRNGFLVHGPAYACAEHRRLKTETSSARMVRMRKRSNRVQAKASSRFYGQEGEVDLHDFFVHQHGRGHTPSPSLILLLHQIESDALSMADKIAAVEAVRRDYVSDGYSLAWLVSQMEHVGAFLKGHGVDPADTAAVIEALDPMDPEDEGVQALLHRLYAMEPRLFRITMIWAEAWLGARKPPGRPRKSAS